MAAEQANNTDQLSSWRHRLHEIIFEADTRAGKLFDVALLIVIVLSIIAVMLESVLEIREQYGVALRAAEWVFTILFTIEYVLRLICVLRPLRYARSFFGVVDLLAVLPTYLTIMLPGAQLQSLIVIRSLRLLRVFRVLKLAHFIADAAMLRRALSRSGRKVIVFLGTVLSIALIMGALMYLIEGRAGSGFTSIPRSMYWAIVTLTTVGYGDIAPATVLGQFVASFIMILGYSIIAVPTGIVSVELAQARSRSVTTQACPSCMREGHAGDATFCKYCGQQLNPSPE